MNVAIQPCGDLEAQKHYQDTIENPVPKEKILPFLSAQQRADFEEVCGDQTAVWGVTPGKLGQNKAKWERLSPGDIALLYRAKRIFSMGRIVLTMHNEDLAASLWSRTSEGVTWEYIYFLDDLQEIDVPVSRYNAALGYAPNNIVQGFNLHQEPQSEIVLSLLGLEADEAFPEPKETSTEALQAQLSAIAGTDAASVGIVRTEQGILRTYLFGKKLTDFCDLCGRQFPVGFLVAAHIKRRESCTDEERRCLDIVMRACKFGCDELFERGFVYVDPQGVIQPSPSFHKSTDDLKMRPTRCLVGQLRHLPQALPGTSIGTLTTFRGS